MPRLPPLLVAALLLAGCAAKGPGDAAPAPGPPAGGGEAGAGPSNVASSPTTASAPRQDEGNATLAPALPANVTRFRWAPDWSGDVAVRLEFTMPAQTDCSYSVAAEGTRPDRGPGAVYLVGPASRDPSGFGGGGTATSVHAGPLDTEELQGTAGGYTTAGAGNRPGIGGAHEVVLLARGATAGTLLVEWACAAPFTVTNATASRTVRLFNLLNMEGESVQASLAGSSTPRATATATLPAGPVQALLNFAGLQHVEWALATPNGTTAGTILVQQTVVAAQGPAGEYRAEVQRSAAYGDSFWVAFYEVGAPFVPVATTE